MWNVKKLIYYFACGAVQGCVAGAACLAPTVILWFDAVQCGAGSRQNVCELLSKVLAVNVELLHTWCLIY